MSRKAKSRTAILLEWTEEVRKARDAETEREKALKRKKALEDKYRWLGNIKGLLKRDESAPAEAGAPAAKKRKLDEALNTEIAATKISKPRYSEEERKDYREWSASVNKIKQLVKNRRKVLPEEARKAVERARFFDRPFEEGVLESIAAAAGLESNELRSIFAGAPERMPEGDTEDELEDFQI